MVKHFQSRVKAQLGVGLVLMAMPFAAMWMTTQVQAEISDSKPIYEVKTLKWDESSKQWLEGSKLPLHPHDQLTTFRSYNRIEEAGSPVPKSHSLYFVGVLERADNGKPLLLVRFTPLAVPPTPDPGHMPIPTATPIPDADAFQGMNGSPVYEPTGQLIGALVGSAPYGHERLALVRPVDTLMKAFEPDVPGEMAEVPEKQRTEEEAAVTFQPLMPPLQVTGLSNDLLNRADSLVRKVGMRATAGDGPTKDTKSESFLSKYFKSKQDLMGGDAVGVSLMTGDIEMTALGTVSFNPFRSQDPEDTPTYKKASVKLFETNAERGQVLAMGGPVIGEGLGKLPVSAAWIHAVTTNSPNRSIIASFGPPMATLQSEHAESAVIEVGARSFEKMDMVELHCLSNYKGQPKSFRVHITRNPDLMLGLLKLSLTQAVRKAQSRTLKSGTGGRFARATLQFLVGDDARVAFSKSNSYYDPHSLENVLFDDIEEGLNQFSNTSAAPDEIKRIVLDLKLEDVAPRAATARSDAANRPASVSKVNPASLEPVAEVESVRLSKSVFKPGETIEVVTLLQPQRRPPFELRSSLLIPQQVEEGPALLMVQGGATRLEFPPKRGSETASGGTLFLSPKAEFEEFQKRVSRESLVTRLVMPSPVLIMKPSLRVPETPTETSGATVGSDANLIPNEVWGYRLEPLPSEVLKVIQDTVGTPPLIEPWQAQFSELKSTSWILRGVQSIPITIQRDDLGEKPITKTYHEPASISYIVDGHPITTLLPVNQPEVRVIREAVAKIPAAQEPVAQRLRPRHVKKESLSSAKQRLEDGVQSRSWLQTSQEEFLRGRIKNLEVTAAGTLRLQSRLHQLISPTPLPSRLEDLPPGTLPATSLINQPANEQFVWSVAGHHDGQQSIYYVATGPNGRIYRSRTGQLLRNAAPWQKIETGELNVHSLAVDSEGNLFAGSSPRGRVWRFSKAQLESNDPKGELIFEDRGIYEKDKPFDNTHTRQVLSLAVYGNDLFIGTGSAGQFWRMPIKGAIGSAVLLGSLGTGPSFMTSLLAVSSEKLYAGSAENGTVYLLTPKEKANEGELPWQAKAIFSTGQTTVSGLAKDGDSTLYASCAPRGSLFKIPLQTVDGLVPPAPTLLLNWPSGLRGLQRDANGTLWTCSGDTVIQIEKGGTVSMLQAEPQTNLTSIGLTQISDNVPGGMEPEHAPFVLPKILLGQSNFGGFYQVLPYVPDWEPQPKATPTKPDPNNRGTYESSIHDAGSVAKWDGIELDFIAPLITTANEPAPQLYDFNPIRFLQGEDPLIEAYVRTANSPSGPEWKDDSYVKVDFGSGTGVIPVDFPTGRYLQVRFILKDWLRRPELNSFRVNYRTVK